MSDKRSQAEKLCTTIVVFIGGANDGLKVTDREAEILVEKLTNLQTEDPDFIEVDQMLEEINFLRRRIASFTITAAGMKAMIEQREFELHEKRVQQNLNLDDDIPF